MGWLSRALGYERDAPEPKIDGRKDQEMRRQEAEVAKAVARNNRAVRTAYDGLARSVLAEVQKGRK